jgi:hypothetical protein
LLVGTTNVNPAANNVTGHALKAGGLAEHANSGAVVMRLNRTDSDGNILQFYKGTGTVGSIGTYSGDLTVGTGDTGLTFENSADVIHPIDQGTGAARDNAIDLGKSAARFKDLYLSGGVYLGGTAAANLLDDYEEGDYDVTITCGTSGTVTLNSSFNRAQYTKVGRTVHVSGFLVVSSVSSPVGYFTINLPFTPANLTDRAADSTASLVIQGVVSANISDFIGSINESQAIIYVQLGDATTVQNDSANQLQADTYIHFSATYAAA